MAVSKPLSISIKGAKNVVKALDRFGDAGKKEVAEVTEIKAREIEANAKIRAPKDTGLLHQSIHAQKIDDLNWNVGTSLHYAPYMEFGTGRKVRVPEELKELAILFKGKGIREVNLRPQPYLYPAFIIGRAQYIKDLSKSLEFLTKKFNKS